MYDILATECSFRFNGCGCSLKRCWWFQCSERVGRTRQIRWRERYVQSCAWSPERWFRLIWQHCSCNVRCLKDGAYPGACPGARRWPMPLTKPLRAPGIWRRRLSGECDRKMHETTALAFLAVISNVTSLLFFGSYLKCISSLHARSFFRRLRYYTNVRASAPIELASKIKIKWINHQCR